MTEKEKPKCLYCDWDIDINSKDAKEVNSNYDSFIFCDYGCERDYEIALDEIDQK